jgi:PTS system glucose-specific IIC component
MIITKWEVKGMSSRSGDSKAINILSPVTGKAVALEQVPDPVFSQKIIGDGIAVIPSDGRITSPVDGGVASVAETLHAYGFRTKEGLELLIHVGLETVGLKGECFQVHVKAGDQVKAGDLIAQVDLEALAKKQINPITPVLVCGGMEGKSLQYHEGDMEGGKTPVLTILDGSGQESCGEGKESPESGAAGRAASGSQADGR